MTKTCPDCKATVHSTSQPERVVGGERERIAKIIWEHVGGDREMYKGEDSVYLETADAIVAALAATPAVDATQGALALYLNEVQPVDGRVQINVSIDELTVLRHLAADTPMVGGEITDEMVNAAAREMWNDRDARHGGGWNTRDPREVCVIQTKATAKAALKAALAVPPASPLRGRDDLIPAGKQARFKVEGDKGKWFGVFDWHDDPNFDYRTVYALSASPPEQPAAAPVTEREAV